MLDVHLPHAATHTWKDFIIHIATISVGLLIAIGLEQAVLAVHHARERRELADNMRAEAQQNIDVLRRNVDGEIQVMRSYLQLIAMLRAAQPHESVVTVVWPSSGPIPLHYYPARAIWASAKTNGKVALLSDRQSAVYDRLDYNAEIATLSVYRQQLSREKLHSDEYRLAIKLSPGATISVPATEVSSLISDFALSVAAVQTTAHWDANWLGSCKAVAADVRDREDVVPYQTRELAATEARTAQLQ